LLIDKDELRESLTVDDIKKILKDLGSDNPTEDNKNNPIFTTVCHGGDSHKLYYYQDSKSFHCYTHCSDTFDIYELVMKVKNISFPQALRYVATITGRTFGFNSKEIIIEDKIDDWEWINRLRPKKKIDTVLPKYDENVLDVFLPYPHEEWLNEGISPETMRKFEIGYYIREDKITIVHRDINSRFIGVRGRALNPEEIENGKKYMPLTVGNQMYNHLTSMNLYGLHKTKEAVKRTKKLMLLEGEKSVLKCEDYYGDFNFTCAVCSSNITNFQRDLALSLGVEEVFIAFDKFRARKEDESEELYNKRLIEYQERLISFGKKFAPYCRVYILYDNENMLDYKDAPVDKGKEVLEYLMKNKIEIKTNGVK
jgi:DNA primase